MFLHSYSSVWKHLVVKAMPFEFVLSAQSRLEVCNHCRAFVRLDTLKGSRAVAVGIKFQSIRDKMSSITRIKLRAFGYVALGPYTSPKSNN